MFGGVFESTFVAPDDVRESVRELIEYLHKSEAADYIAVIEASGGRRRAGDDHIFNHVENLRGWLEDPWVCWGFRPVAMAVLWGLAVLLAVL